MGAVAHRARRVLLSTVSSDSHTWNLVFLQLLLEENGNEVINLGSCVPDQLLIDVACRIQPDAILISSVNGHGYLDGARLIRGIRAEPRTTHIPAMIGGKLGIHGSDRDAHDRALLAAGFDAVFTEGSDLAALDGFLAGLSPAGAGPAPLPASSAA